MTDEQMYPCEECGKLRKAEGGYTFTLCDECWEKHYHSKKGETNELREKVAKELRKVAGYHCPNKECPTSRDCAECLADQIIALCREELFKWGDRGCLHNEQPDWTASTKKRECPICWQELKGEKK